MRVAIDEQIFAIQAFGGISRVFAELASQFTSSDFDVDLAPLTTPIVNRYVLDDPRLAQALGARQARNEWTALARYGMRIRTQPTVDIVHNTFYLRNGLALDRRAKRVVTVYDMIPEFLPSTKRRLDLVTSKRKYIECADHVICISESTRKDLMKIHPRIEVGVSVVPLGVGSQFRPDLEPLAEMPEKYVLFVGNRNQYKDARVLMRAFAIIAKEFADVQLTFVGGGGFDRYERDVLKNLHLTDQTKQIAVSNARLPAVYANALAFIFPSRFEGFGLPTLEAMACGAPTVLSKAPALLEVGGSAARYFSAGDEKELANQLAEILSSKVVRDVMAHRGIMRAAKYSWEETAIKTANIYRSLLE